MNRQWLTLGLGLMLILKTTTLSYGAGASLLNVSYDPTRELYEDYDQAFAKHWKGETGQDVAVYLSNGGSGKQARAVIDGLEADVATLGLSGDIDAISRKAGLLPDFWQLRLPENSAPYTSTIVLLVREGNPKGIRDFDDLARPGVSVITSSPKTSAGGRWAFLAAWGYALKKYGSPGRALDFVTRLYRNVPVLDSGARGATTTFVERGIGDVLVAWENEARLAVKEFGGDKFQVVTPSASILAEPAVAMVDKNAQKHGNSKLAEAYLRYLYSTEGQEIIAHHYYRPRSKAALAKFAGRFPKVKLFTIDKMFGGWRKAQDVYFAEGGVFDQFYQPGKRGGQ